MLVVLIVVKIDFKAAFPNMLPEWNAPLGKVARVKLFEKQLFAIFLPWRFALHIIILKTLESPISLFFYAYEIVLALTKNLPIVQALLFLLSSCLYQWLVSLSYSLSTSGKIFSRQGLWSCSHCDQATRTIRHADLFLRSFQVVGIQCHFLVRIQVLTESWHALGVRVRLFLWYQLNIKMEPTIRSVILYRVGCGAMYTPPMLQFRVSRALWLQFSLLCINIPVYQRRAVMPILG